MKLIIFATLIVIASAFEDEISSKIKDKRQVLLGGLGYGGLGYGGLGYGLGAYPYGGIYPAGYGLGFVGRKRREVAEEIEEVDDEAKEKRQLLLGGALPLAGYGLGYGLPYAGYGVGLPYAGFPAVIGRKRREVAEEDAAKEKRHLLLGAGVLPVAGYGYGYGLPVAGYGLGLGYGAVDTGFGIPAVYGRKRRDVAEEESAKEKRQLLLGGALPVAGYGLGYGLPYAGYGVGLPYAGFPAIYGRKRRDVEEVVDKAAHEKRQVVGAVGGVYPGVVPAVGGVYPGVVHPGVVPAVGGVYPGVVPAVGAYPVGGVVGGYPGVGVGVGAPGVIL